MRLTSFHFQYTEVINHSPILLLCKEGEEYGTRQLLRSHKEAICKANSLYSDIQNVSTGCNLGSHLLCLFTHALILFRVPYYEFFTQSDRTRGGPVRPAVSRIL